MEQDSPASLWFLSNHQQFESQQQSHNETFFGWLMCVYLSFNNKKTETNTIWHTIYRAVIWQEAKRRRGLTRVPTSAWNIDNLPQPFFPFHFYSFFPFIFSLALSLPTGPHTKLPGGWSFWDDCWIAFQPMLPEHIFFKAEFPSLESLVL